MMSLASDLLILGKQSQLGPTDPQIQIGNAGSYSARAIQEGFSKAREDIEKDIKLAHLWAPILQNMGPSLALESEKALSYSKGLVTKWLRKRCLIGDGADSKAETIAAYFNAEPSTKHGQVYVHGQRIGTENSLNLVLT